MPSRSLTTAGPRPRPTTSRFERRTVSPPRRGDAEKNFIFFFFCAFAVSLFLEDEMAGKWLRIQVLLVAVIAMLPSSTTRAEDNPFAPYPTPAGLIAEIGDVRRFNCDDDKVAKLAGFKWRRHQSADFVADDTPTHHCNSWFVWSCICWLPTRPTSHRRFARVRARHRGVSPRTHRLTN